MFIGVCKPLNSVRCSFFWKRGRSCVSSKVDWVDWVNWLLHPFRLGGLILGASKITIWVCWINGGWGSMSRWRRYRFKLLKVYLLWTGVWGIMVSRVGILGITLLVDSSFYVPSARFVATMWSKMVPSKICIFIWRLKLGRILVRRLDHVVLIIT